MGDYMVPINFTSFGINVGISNEPRKQNFQREISIIAIYIKMEFYDIHIRDISVIFIYRADK